MYKEAGTDKIKKKLTEAIQNNGPECYSIKVKGEQPKAGLRKRSEPRPITRKGAIRMQIHCARSRMIPNTKR